MEHWQGRNGRRGEVMAEEGKRGDERPQRTYPQTVDSREQTAEGM